jgi:hypothetical protein
MNFPVRADANQCRDLLFKKESHTEVFDRNNPPMPNCTKPDYFVHSRTQKPLKETTVKVNAEDYGAYGFVRSFANINQGGRDSIKGETPVYEPVPIAANKVAHPSRRKKKNIYLDDRVTVPRDVDENRIADNGWRSTGNAGVNDPENPRGDDDTQLSGDGYPGDGLSNYEEYRGFFIKGKHIRTEIANKDLFIHNPDKFNLANFEEALSDTRGIFRVNIHQIDEKEYISNTVREINFNYNPNLHYLPSFYPLPPPFNNIPEPTRVQKGLQLVRRLPFKGDPGSLGLTIPVPGMVPLSPPNWVRAILIFEDNIVKHAKRVRINVPAAITNTVSHETGHAIAIYHHGEGYVMNGLQSGNTNCFMRYDNVEDDPFDPNKPTEPIGTILCSSPRGTGTNATDGAGKCINPVNCFGDATRGRGDCIHQFRISCRTIFFPIRL